MVDDAGAVGGSGGLGALEWEAEEGFMEELAVASGTMVEAGVGSGSRPQSLQKQGQGVDPVTKLGHLVKYMKIKSLSEICFFSCSSRNLRSLNFSWGYPSRTRL